MLDHEQMKDEFRQRPFSPPPEHSLSNTLTILCIVVCSAILLYRGVGWWREQGAAAKPAAQHQQAEQAPETARLESVLNPPQKPMPIPAPVPAPDPQAVPNVPNSHAVTKCITNGKTSYGDHSCDQGAAQIQVVTRPNQNLMAAVPVPAAIEQPKPTQQQILASQSTKDTSTAYSKDICQAMDAEIARLDALARQPQTAQVQDWITAKRRKIRDEQFRLPCR